MSRWTLLIAAGIVLTLGAAPKSQATVLIFQNSGAGLGDSFSYEADAYGDRVTTESVFAEGIGGNNEYGSEGGWTPNVVVDYSDAVYGDGDTFGDLTNVLRYERDYGSGGVVTITLVADPGYQVRLHSFDMGGWYGDRLVSEVSVRDASNVKLYASYNEYVEGGNGHTSFVFTTPLTDTRLQIYFNVSNLQDGYDEAVGIDNIVFSQVPEPSTFALLAMAAAVAALAAWRKHRRISAAH